MSAQRLVGNTNRETESQEVQALRQQNERLKQLVAELALKNRVLKTSVAGKESEGEIWHDVSYGLTNLPPDVSPP